MRWSCCRRGTRRDGCVTLSDMRAGIRLTGEDSSSRVEWTGLDHADAAATGLTLKKVVDICRSVVRNRQDCRNRTYNRSLCRSNYLATLPQRSMAARGWPLMAYRILNAPQNRKIEMKNSLVLATVIAAAALVACGKKEEAAPVAAPAVEAPAAAPVETAPVAPAADAAAPAAAADAAAAGAAANAADASADAAKASEEAAKAAADAAAGAAAAK